MELVKVENYIDRYATINRDNYKILILERNNYLFLDDPKYPEHTRCEAYQVIKENKEKKLL